MLRAGSSRRERADRRKGTPGKERERVSEVIDTKPRVREQRLESREERREAKREERKKAGRSRPMQI